MFRKSVLPPTLSWLVRSRRTPRSWKRRVRIAVDDRRADLRLDIVADDRQPFLSEPLLPVRLAGDKDRNAVHQTAAGFEDLLDIPLGRFFRADRQVVHDDIGLGVLEAA